MGMPGYSDLNMSTISSTLSVSSSPKTRLIARNSPRKITPRAAAWTKDLLSGHGSPRYIRRRGGVQNRIPEWHIMPKVIAAHTAASQIRSLPGFPVSLRTAITAIDARMTSATIRISLSRKLSATMGESR